VASEPREFNWPISIDVQDGQVIAIWYVNDYGQDRLLTKGEHYHVSYHTTISNPEQSSETKKDEEIDWLQPKRYPGTKAK
jgi:hypothetical protein